MANNSLGINCLNDFAFSTIYRSNEKLGSYGSIDIEKSRWKIGCNSLRYLSVWSAAYTIDGRRFINMSIQSFIVDTIVDGFYFDFETYYYSGYNSSPSKDIINFIIDRRDKDFLGSTTRDPIRIYGGNLRKKNKTITALGYVIETRAYLYKIDESKGGLVVVEEKRKSGDDKKPCKVTVANYFTFGSGNMFNQNKIDIGLSVIATIQPSRKGGFDITFEGPTKHHIAALHNMFHEVMETGIWNPTKCPNCPRIERILSDLLRQVNSEYNSSGPKKVTLIDNSGSIIGDNNGYLEIKGGLYIFNIYGNFLESSQSIIKTCIMLGVQESDIEM